MIAFGPVPSRRLGRSLGINNVPAKTCSYSCIYCQLGTTTKMQIERRTFYEPSHVFTSVEKKVNQATSHKEQIDYLTFVPDGEPTLDIALGQAINLLKTLKINIAVITNASLIYRKDVQKDLANTDLVSLKVDAVTNHVWHKMNRPHGLLKLRRILDGMLDFATTYQGEIITETMLVKNINDSEEEVKNIAEFLAKLPPSRAYIAIPTRPPAEKWVQPASESMIHRAYQTFSESLENSRVEYLLGYEGTAFAFTGNIVQDLLSITAVHPMRKDAVKALLEKAKGGWAIIESLIDEEKLIELQYSGHTFYMRKLPSR
jgi:wyosine [tRNA(Phe)-imidazoG37] synthetase (radical SAM superfamily)